MMLVSCHMLVASSMTSARCYKMLFCCDPDVLPLFFVHVTAVFQSCCSWLSSSPLPAPAAVVTASVDVSAVSATAVASDNADVSDALV